MEFRQKCLLLLTTHRRMPGFSSPINARDCMQPAHHIESSFAKFGEQKYHPLSSKVMQTSIILYSFLWNLVISVKCSAFHGEFIGFSSIFAGNLWCQDHGHISKVGSRGVDGVEKKIKSSLNIRTALRVEGGQTCQRMQGWWVGLEKAVNWGGPTICKPVSRKGTSLKKKITLSSDSNPNMAIGNEGLFIFFLLWRYIIWEAFLVFAGGASSQVSLKEGIGFKSGTNGTRIWRRTLRGKRIFRPPLRQRCHKSLLPLLICLILPLTRLWRNHLLTTTIQTSLGLRLPMLVMGMFQMEVRFHH